MGRRLGGEDLGGLAEMVAWGSSGGGRPRSRVGSLQGAEGCQDRDRLGLGKTGARDLAPQSRIERLYTARILIGHNLVEEPCKEDPQ